MREFNQIDIIDGLKADKSVVIKTIQDNYKIMLVEFLKKVRNKDA